MIGSVKKVGIDILLHAIKHGNVHDIIALIHDNEVDVNCKNINGQTPLHVSQNDKEKTLVVIAVIKFEFHLLSVRDRRRQYYHHQHLARGTSVAERQGFRRCWR